MRRAGGPAILASLTLAAACGGPPAPVAPLTATAPAGACADELLDEAYGDVALVAVGDGVAWQHAWFGSIHRRDRAGAVTIRVPSQGDDAVSGLAAAGGDLYRWNSRGAAVERLALDGGPAEPVLDVAGVRDVVTTASTVWALTEIRSDGDGPLSSGGGVAWRRGEQRGRLDGVVFATAIAADGAADGLLFTTFGGIYAVGTSGPITELVALTSPALGLGATADTIYWAEEAPDVTMALVAAPRHGGARRELARWPLRTTVVFAPRGGERLVAHDNVVELITADDRVVPLGFAPTTIVDLAWAGDRLYVATDVGGVHTLCVDAAHPFQPLPYDPLDPDHTYYASGHVRAHTPADGDYRTVEQFYADGRPLLTFRAGASPVEPIYQFRYRDGGVALERSGQFGAWRAFGHDGAEVASGGGGAW